MRSRSKLSAASFFPSFEGFLSRAKCAVPAAWLQTRTLPDWARGSFRGVWFAEGPETQPVRDTMAELVRLSKVACGAFDRDPKGGTFGSLGTALITGSTDGLGRSVARKLAANGFTVLVHGRDRERSERLVSEIRAESGTIAFYEAHPASLRA